MSSSNRTTTTDALAITAQPPSKRLRTTTNHGPRRIVAEHEYSQGLSQVIQQQYFPDLPHLQKALTNGESESESDLPDNLPVATDQQETVTEYHARVTSEDNADFDQIQRREFQQRQKARIQQALEYYAPPKTVARPDSALALASDAFDPSPHRPPMLTNREDLAHLATQHNTLMMFPASTQHADGTNSQQLLTNGSTNSSDNATTIPTTTAQQADGDLMPPPASTQPRIEPSATRFPRSEKDSLRTIIQQQQQQQNQLSNHRPRAWSTSLESDVEGDHSSIFSTDDESGGAAGSDLDATPLRSIDSERRQYQQHRQTQQPYGMVVDHNSTTNNLRRRSVFAATPVTHRDQAAATALERIHERGRRAAAAKGASSAKRKKATSTSTTSSRRGSASSSRTSNTSSSLSSRLQQQPSSNSRRPSSRMSNSFGSALRASYLRPSSSSKF